jgi:hypothetical protein
VLALVPVQHLVHTSNKTQLIIITEMNELCRLGELTAVYSEIHMELGRRKIICRQNAELSIVKARGIATTRL